jgi:O-methyltransferase
VSGPCRRPRVPKSRDPLWEELGATPADAADLYLSLIRDCLTRALFEDEEMRPVPAGQRWKRLIRDLFRRRGIELVRRAQMTAEIRDDGRDWRPDAERMVGRNRLDNLRYCVADVIASGVPGDLIETGVWRGDAVIFMRAVLKAYRITDRVVWVADSFRGLSGPDAHWMFPELAASLEQVKHNFQRYGLLDGQVRFRVGRFKDTLRMAPVERLAILCLNGDMYQSTMLALTALYPKLSVGGYCIVDNYNCVASCRAAVEDYRSAHGITEPIKGIAWGGAFWQRLRRPEPGHRIPMEHRYGAHGRI